MATGSDLRRYDVCPQVPVPDASAASDEPDELDKMERIDALGSAPVVRVQWPEILDLPRRRSVWPAIALLGSAAAIVAAALVVVANQPPRRANAVELPAVARATRDARPARPSESYRAAIRSHERELHRCVQFHGEMFPVDAEAVIMVGIEGRAEQVSLRPDSAEHSALGSCIRGVLGDVTFPAARSEMEVAVGLAVYR
jgi:hypothetical protein